MWSEIAAIYKASKKKRDINRFTEYVARPPAAIVVYFLAKTPITPNQVTFLSAVVAAGAAAMFALLPGYWWLVAAALVFEFSFVLDCADGQLARLRKIASPLGHLLDFLMDELKAMFIYAAVAVRLWQDSSAWAGLHVETIAGDRATAAFSAGDVSYLLIGLGGLFCLAAGLSLTSFTRRPEYGAKPITEDGQPADVGGGKRGPVGLVLYGVEWVARVIVHYPQYIWICALANRIDIYFWAYTAVNVLYLGKTFASIFFRLGRFKS